MKDPDSINENLPGAALPYPLLYSDCARHSFKAPNFNQAEKRTWVNEGSLLAASFYLRKVAAWVTINVTLLHRKGR